MPRIGYRAGLRLLLVALAVLMLPAAGELPPELRRGVNITNWFRFPPSGDPAALRGYLDDAALRELRRAGFTFIRLPVQAQLVAAKPALADAVARVQRHGFAVVVALFGLDWHLETEKADRARLIATWRTLADVLRPFDPRVTFPEVLNEPVFAGDPAAWADLQRTATATIRALLPRSTIVLTGADWGSVGGLLALHPEADRRVIYSFHIYEPPELTSLGAYRPGLDTAAMARLPFPADDPAACAATAATARDAATADLMRFYCAQRWDAARVADRIAAAALWGRQRGVPVLAGEFGATQLLNAPARLAWLRTVREACEREGIGWALWGYDDGMGFGMYPPGRRPLDPGVLDALGLAPRK